MNDLHPFQQKGLGFAPFRFLHLRREPGGCAYCGQSLAWTCHVADVDGREFVVGTDCVAKTCTDSVLHNEATRELKRQQKAARQAAKHAKVEDLFERRKAAQAALQTNPALLTDVPYVSAFDGKEYGVMRRHAEYLLRGYLSTDSGIKQVEQGCKLVEAAR